MQAAGLKLVSAKVRGEFHGALVCFIEVDRLKTRILSMPWPQRDALLVLHAVNPPHPWCCGCRLEGWLECAPGEELVVVSPALEAAMPQRCSCLWLCWRSGVSSELIFSVN